MASDHEDHNSRSNSHKDDGSDDDSAADSADEAPKADEHPDSNDPTLVVPDSYDMGSRKTSSNVDRSTSLGSHNSSESEVEVVTIWTTA